MATTHTIAKTTPKRKIPPAERNRDLLIGKLAAGSWVAGQTWEDGAYLVPSTEDPTGDPYHVMIKQDTPVAPMRETCTCPAMDGGPGSYHKAVVRWKNRDGQWENNGVLPCSHILVLRLYLKWIGTTPAQRRELLDTIPGLEQALKESGHI